MKNFACTSCGTSVYFENNRCFKCRNELGFSSSQRTMVALREQAGKPGVKETIGGSDSRPLKYCGNAAHGVCNWLIPLDDPTGLCTACNLNRTIPNLGEPGSLSAWIELEKAKKRLVYALLRFGLPLDSLKAGKGRLTFDFARGKTTGHLDGVITVNISEADAVERERQRQIFGEPYRSLLGHLRHESGHFYWMVLVEAAGRLDKFRALFGDERQDYTAALNRNRAGTVVSDWQSSFVSSYASSHPWEDWAETWAHYLHMVDAVDTAEAAGMEPRAVGLILGALWPFKSYDVYTQETFKALKERWIPLTVAMNCLSRSLGHEDFYPFVIPAPVFEKLAFVHQVIREHANTIGK